ncbi:MAG: 3-oxoacyl-[acyl-carrier-protein] reductase [Nitrospiraceae bacterium]|nr:3-oxoacyl-[acyl-carrier-protein] reductase [Nitrospiraceae bacterium]
MKEQETEPRLSEQVALVTGANRGIGWAIGGALLAAGVRVAFGCRTGADAVQERIRALPGGERGAAVVLDMSDSASIEAALDSVLHRWGRVDILVNNAGIVRDRLLLRMDEAEFREVIDVNLVGPFRMVKAVLRPMMKQRYGRIVSISSVVGATGNAGQANYAASKGGLEAFSKSVALEVASRGITVNVIAPGFIETDMTAGLPENVTSGVLERIPVRRFGRGEEIAHAVRFLVDPAAGYITGAVVPVNGGLYMP